MSHDSRMKTQPLRVDILPCSCCVIFCISASSSSLLGFQILKWTSRWWTLVHTAWVREMLPTSRCATSAESWKQLSQKLVLFFWRALGSLRRRWEEQVNVECEILFGGLKCLKCNASFLLWCVERWIVLWTCLRNSSCSRMSWNNLSAGKALPIIWTTAGCLWRPRGGKSRDSAPHTSDMRSWLSLDFWLFCSMKFWITAFQAESTSTWRSKGGIQHRFIPPWHSNDPLSMSDLIDIMQQT